MSSPSGNDVPHRELPRSLDQAQQGVCDDHERRRARLRPQHPLGSEQHLPRGLTIAEEQLPCPLKGGVIDALPRPANPAPRTLGLRCGTLRTFPEAPGCSPVRPRSEVADEAA